MSSDWKVRNYEELWLLEVNHTYIFDEPGVVARFLNCCHPSLFAAIHKAYPMELQRLIVHYMQPKKKYEGILQSVTS